MKYQIKSISFLTSEIKRLKEDLHVLEKTRQEYADELAALQFKDVSIGDRHSNTEEVTRLEGPTWNKSMVKRMVTETFEVVKIGGLVMYDHTVALRVMAGKVNKDGSLSKAQNASSLTARPDEWKTVIVKPSQA